jgi:hypothetical protein
MKGRTQPPPASDPISLNISIYYTGPLGARRILEAELPPTHDRNDLSADPIYFHHPSATENPQHPLLLQHETPTLNSVIIENYFVTGIQSTNSKNDKTFPRLHIPPERLRQYHIHHRYPHNPTRLHANGGISYLALSHLSCNGHIHLRRTTDNRTRRRPIRQNHSLHPTSTQHLPIYISLDPPSQPPSL